VEKKRTKHEEEQEKGRRWNGKPNISFWRFSGRLFSDDYSLQSTDLWTQATPTQWLQAAQQAIDTSAQARERWKSNNSSAILMGGPVVR
jgi:hypothetical protein